MAFCPLLPAQKGAKRSFSLFSLSLAVPEFVTEAFNSLEAVLAWMEQLPAVWAYLVVLCIAYGEHVFPPIPGDMVVVFGGYLAGSGALSLPLVIAMATLGGGLGFMSVYAIGRRFGQAVLEPGRFRWVSQRGVAAAQDWLRRWGYGVVAANRFLTGVRSVIALAVGVARMDAWKTAFWATGSAAVWCTLIAYAGYTLGDNWRLVRRYLADYSRVVLAVLVVALAAWGGYRLWQARRPPPPDRERDERAGPRRPEPPSPSSSEHSRSKS